MFAIRLAGVIVAVVQFARAAKLIRKLRGGYRWTDPPGLQPQYHDESFRAEIRRFLWYLGAAVAVSLLLIVSTQVFPS